MPIEVKLAEDSDVLEIFTIASRSFAFNEEYFTAHFPGHDTPEGRENGAQRFLTAGKEDPNLVLIKAVDSATGRIAGFARWVIFTNSFISAPVLEPQHWNTFEDAEYAHALSVEFLKYRSGHLNKMNGNMVSLDICAVDPDYQRKGVGGQLVSWGIAKADELGVEAVVESSVFGKGLYEKHGFVFLQDVVLPVPEKFGPRPESRFAWLIRPKTAKSTS